MYMWSSERSPNSSPLSTDPVLISQITQRDFALSSRRTLVNIRMML